MKKLIALPFFCLALAGCSDGLPSECATTLKDYDSLISQAPDQMKSQLQESRKIFEDSVKKLDKAQAVQACKITNESFAQIKQAFPK